MLHNVWIGRDGIHCIKIIGCHFPKIKTLCFKLHCATLPECSRSSAPYRHSREPRMNIIPSTMLASLSKYISIAAAFSTFIKPAMIPSTMLPTTAQPVENPTRPPAVWQKALSVPSLRFWQPHTHNYTVLSYISGKNDPAVHRRSDRFHQRSESKNCCFAITELKNGQRLFFVATSRSPRIGADSHPQSNSYIRKTLIPIRAEA